MGPDGVIHDGLVVGVLFSSGGIGFAFQGGYEPSGESGASSSVTILLATAALSRSRAGGRSSPSTGNRRPESTIAGSVERLRTSWRAAATSWPSLTMHPVGIDVGKIEGITSYLLIHPDKILADGALSTFASIRSRCAALRHEGRARGWSAVLARCPPPPPRCFR